MPTANAGYHAYATGDVLSASQVQYNLQNQTVMYFATSAARTTALSGVLVEGMVSYIPGTGIQYYNGSAWTTVGGGGGGGKVLQVVSATTATPVTIASTTLTDTGLTATITPSATTSRVLVLVTQPIQGYVGAGTTSPGYGVILDRNGTTVYDDLAGGNAFYTDGYSGGAQQIQTVFAISYTDSPASTSALTYKTRAKTYSTSGGRTLATQAQSTASSIVLLEIGA